MSNGKPPEWAILVAVSAAKLSPCQKSKRGAVVFLTAGAEDLRIAYTGVGYNGPPASIVCDGSEACRSSCGRRCVHAESRALRGYVIRSGLLGEVSGADVDLVHVKVENDALVAGGGPSCWQCSREILDLGIGGVWLFLEMTGCETTWNPVTGETTAVEVGERVGMWRRYTAEEFHRVTCENAKGGPVYLGERR